MSISVTIRSTGSYLPEKVLSNQDLAISLGIDQNWITQRTGVMRRHVAAKDQATSDLATIAAKRALENANMVIDDIDMILVSTGIPDTTFPPTACRVHKNLGAVNIPAMDISASCSGFLYAIATANAYIKSAMAKNILLVCSEIRSKFINYQDPNTASVYGDGAGAVILSVSGEKDKGFIDINLGVNSKGSQAITIPAGGTRMPPTHETIDSSLHYIHFHDKSIIRSAVRGIKEEVDARLKYLDIDKDQIDVVIAHQMNLRMLESLSKRMKISIDKFVINIQNRGNTSSASIPIAMDEAIGAGKIKSGDLGLFISYGAGFTWGSSFYRF